MAPPTDPAPTLGPLLLPSIVLPAYYVTKQTEKDETEMSTGLRDLTTTKSKVGKKQTGQKSLKMEGFG